MKIPLLALACLAALAPAASADDDAVMTPQRGLTRSVAGSLSDSGDAGTLVMTGERPLARTIAAEASRVGQHPTPTQPAKDSPYDDYRFLGDMKELRPLKRNGDTTIWADGGDGTAENPKHFYLTWSGMRGRQSPLLVFCQPSDGQHPEPPQDINLMSRPLDWAQDMPIQVWQYPTAVTAQRGLYAAVFLERGQKQPKLLQPILWWGLSQGQELDSVDPKDAPKMIEKWFGSDQP